MSKQTAKPFGYWNSFENCKEEVMKFSKKTEFMKKRGATYNSIIKHGWLSLLDHLEVRPRKHSGYWTYEKCKEEAVKYVGRYDFEKESKRAYRVALSNGWMDDICGHMIPRKKPANYWTYEKCKEEAMKYKTRGDFSDNSTRAYRVALTNGWLGDFCSHMISPIKPANYWTYEKCKEEAMKYKTKGEFQSGSRVAYTKARISGWFDDVCGHMLILGDSYNRCIYSFTFNVKNQNYIYVGLTHDINERFRSHKTHGSVFEFCKKHNIQLSSPNQLTDYINVLEAMRMEGVILNQHIDNGFIPINKVKVGSLGGGHQPKGVLL